MRAVIIVCLSLFLLLFKANKEAYAAASTISKGESFSTSTTSTNQQQVPFGKHINAHVQKSLSTKEASYAEGNQSEDESLSKKGLICLRTVYLYYALLTGWHKIPQKLALPYCEHLSYTGSFKYLLLKVFRI